MSGITGTWRLISTRATDPDGNPVAPPYGPAPMGMVTFGDDGRMLAALCTGGPAPEGPRAHVSYGGDYRFDGRTLVTRVDVSSDPGRIGGEQVRDAEFHDDGRLTLRPPPREVGGRPQNWALTWERIAP